MTVVALLLVAIVLVMVLLWIELMEFAVLFLAAIIIMVSTAVWLEPVPIFTIFTALGLWHSRRGRASRLQGNAERAGAVATGAA